MTKDVFLVYCKKKGNTVMHVKGFLHKLLGNVIHKSRLKALSEVVEAAILTKELRLTTLGRSIDTGIQERSGIQKVNRLYGNANLLREKEKIFAAISQLLLGIKNEWIIVDWTKYPESNDAILRGALATKGRALTLYEERHPVKKMGNKKIQSRFLKNLKAVLPNECKAIIITDAGFHNDWFREVLTLGWDYVGRIRNNKKYQGCGKNAFYYCRSLFKYATEKARWVGKVILTRENPLETHLYLVKKPLRGRKVYNRNGKVKRDKDSKAYSRSYREPWLLASSLHGRGAAQKIKKIYERRMSIEEAFRDLKCTRYGLGLRQVTTRREQRREVILLIAMLASLIAWLVGSVGEKMKLHYQFQSNSIKNRRVISLFYLGCRLIKKKVSINLSSIWKNSLNLRG